MPVKRLYKIFDLKSCDIHGIYNTVVRVLENSSQVMIFDDVLYIATEPNNIHHVLKTIDEEFCYRFGWGDRTDIYAKFA